MSEIISIIALSLILCRHIPYAISTFKTKTTKPHPVSWLTNSVFATFSSIVMFQNGAGGAIVGGIGTVIAGVVFGVAGVFSFKKLVKQGSLKIGPFDIASICISSIVFMLSLLGVFPPTVAMYCMCTAGVFAYVPTMLKIAKLPHSENALSYAASVAGRSLSLMAANSYSMDAIYPVIAWIITESVVFAVIVVSRKRNLSVASAGRVILAVPGSGKTMLASMYPDKYIDMETHDYEWMHDCLSCESYKTIKPWSLESGGNPEWPDNYLKAINDALDNANDTVLLLTYRKDVAEMLARNGIEFTLAVPSQNDGHVYQQRYLERGNTEDFANYLNTIWDQTILDMNSSSNEKIFLEPGEYLQHAIETKAQPKRKHRALYIFNKLTTEHKRAA